MSDVRRADLITRQNKTSRLCSGVLGLFVRALCPRMDSTEELSQRSERPFPDVSHCCSLCVVAPGATLHNDDENLSNKHHCLASARVIIAAFFWTNGAQPLLSALHAKMHKTSGFMGDKEQECPKTSGPVALCNTCFCAGTCCWPLWRPPGRLQRVFTPQVHNQT